MRKACLGILFLFALGVSSQNKQLLYGFNEIPQAMLLNPGAEVDFKYHFGLPLLSHIHFDVGNTGPTVYDLFADNGVNFNVKLRNSLANLSSTDFVSVNQQLEIFNAGFKSKRFSKETYISFGLYQETDVFMKYPKDYLRFAYYGNSNPTASRFNLANLNFQGELLTVFHLGINQKINKQLTVGLRGKIYSCIINVNSINNAGSFFTIQGQNNFYQHTLTADLAVQTSGYATLSAENPDGTAVPSNEVAKKLAKRALLGGDLGLGVDLGLTYHIDEQVTFTASLVDLGFITHVNDVESYSLKGTYSLEGLNLLFPEVITGSGDTNDYWQQISNEIEEQLPFDTLTTKYTTWRSPKFYSSLKYAWGIQRDNSACDCKESNRKNYLNAVGGQLFYTQRPRGSQAALTLFYYRYLFKALRLKASYTADSYSLTNLGAGMSMHFGPANFYIMADNLLAYKNLASSSKVSLQLGFNYIVPIKKK